MGSLLRSAAFAALASTASAAEDGAGYYHPPVTSEETFVSDLKLDPERGADRDRRVNFVTTLTASQVAQPDSPPYVVFAKGDEADRLYLIGLDDQMFKTLFRARAVLAQMTSKIRSGGYFEGTGLRNQATFFDMLAAMGFESLVISDGSDWAHRVSLSTKGHTP